MKKPKREIPQLGHPIIETHCHLDYLKQASTQQILDGAQAVGVEKVVTIAVAPTNLGTVRKLTAAHEIVFATQGIHPHEAETYGPSVEAEIRTHIDGKKILAVGEIGLDYYYDHADRTVQREVFANQLKIAIEANKPIVVHSREADADTAAILAEYAPALTAKGVIHSFTSSLELAERCLDMGFCLGFNGIITFNKADNVRQVLAATPIDRVLLETDAPYLTPVPYRGAENAPNYLPFVAEKVAEVKQTSVGEVLSTTYQNSERVLFQSSLG